MNPPPDPREVARLMEMFTLLDRLDQPKFTPEFMEKRMVTCPSCSRRREILDAELFPTGLSSRAGTPVRAVDPTCPSCQSNLKGTAKLVCLSCEPPRVIARIAPNTDKKTGLRFRADRCYHANGCPACRPGQVTQIIEQLVMIHRQSK